MGERILLVDDEKDLLEVLDEFLTEKGYQVSTAQNASQALDLVGREQFDLILSDINMPGTKGFELLAEVAQIRPTLKRALITAYDVRDYLRMARDHDVGNIIAKTTPFNFDEVELLIRNILTEDVFGLSHYVQGAISETRLNTAAQVEPLIARITQDFPDNRQRRRFRQALGEIMINAFYYGARSERGDRKGEWSFDVTLSPEEEITVAWGMDEEKSGVLVADQKGRLTKKDVLYWLERNTTKGDDGLSHGLFDEHGKGLFITREIIDRLIINTKRTARTEVVMLNYREGLYDGFRPLWIHEF